MIVDVNESASQQVAPIETTIKKCNMLMYYAHTYPNVTIIYYASDTYLHVDSDTAWQDIFT